MEENKVNFLYPKSPTIQIPAPTNFVINPICTLSSQEIGLNNFNVSPRQVSITQIYASRKIKHPSFRKRASSGTMPYYIPFRHRQRTKSESADVSNTQQTQIDSMDCENINEKISGTMETDIHSQLVNNLQFNKIKISQLKKSKSMESLLPKPDVEKESNANVSSSSTLEFVSSRIASLHLPKQ